MIELKESHHIFSQGVQKMIILDLRIFCNTNSSGKINFAPTFKKDGLPEGVEIIFNSNGSSLDLTDWWNVKTLLQDNEKLIVVTSDYNKFVTGTIICAICSDKEQYKLGKILVSLQRTNNYLSSLVQ